MRDLTLRLGPYLFRLTLEAPEDTSLRGQMDPVSKRIQVDPRQPGGAVEVIEVVFHEVLHAGMAAYGHDPEAPLSPEKACEVHGLVLAQAFLNPKFQGLVQRLCEDINSGA